MNGNYNLNEIIDNIIRHTDNQNCRAVVEKTINKYFEINSPVKIEIFNEVFQSLLWVAEKTRDSNNVNAAAQCYLSDDVISILDKYKGNALRNIFSGVVVTIESNLKLELIRKYIQWVNNGWISKLLNFVSEFPGNGNLKLEQDVYSLLDMDVNNLEKFDEFALKINRKKLPIEKKVELLSILMDIVRINREDYAYNLLDNRIDDVKKHVEAELGTKLSKTNYSLRCGVKFLEDLKKDPNAEFLLKKQFDHNKIKNWIFSDAVTKDVVEELRSHGFNPDLYIASGKTIAQKRTNGMFSDNLAGTFKRVVIEIIGSKKNNALPKVSIYKYSPGSIFRMIKNDYFMAVNDQNMDAMKNVIGTLKEIIIKAYEKRNIPKTVSHALNKINDLEFILKNGGTFSFRGAKVTAKVWKRKIPEDLYDSEKLWCCFFLPQGEKSEIPLFMMDPKTTLLQFHIQGLTNPVSIAFICAGIVDKTPVLLVDTWEGGGLVYAALGQEKMKEFALESMKKFAEKVGAKKLLVFANPNYSRAREFVNYLRDKGLRPQKIYFEAVDANDSVLEAYSKRNKHHSTDSFGLNPSKGNIDAFVIE